MIDQVTQPKVEEVQQEKPLQALTTIYFFNAEKKQFFKQNSLTGGTYLECWVKGKEFAHILATVELGTADHLSKWMKEKNLVPGTREEYESYFFHLCREVESKRTIANEYRQKLFNQSK